MPAAKILPSVIVKSFLWYVLSGYYGKLYTKKAIALLAVCQTWREYALPLVYNKLYFYSNAPSFKSFKCGRHTRYSRTAAGRTNIDLIKDLNVSHLVKELKFSIYMAPRFIDYFIDEADNIFEFGKHDWSKISSIDLVVPEFNNEHGEHENFFDNDTKQKITLFVQKLFNVMPNVVKLSGRVGNDDINRFFEKELVAVYGSQLRQCDNGTWESQYEYQKSTSKLSKVTVRLDSTILQKNYICPELLTELNIFNVVSFKQLFEFLLGPFSDKKITSLSNLKTLYIGFQPFRPAVIDQYINLDFKNSFTQFFSLETIDIGAPFASDLIYMLKSANFSYPNLKKLKISINFTDYGNMSKDECISGLTFAIRSLETTMPKLSMVELERHGRIPIISTLLNCLSSGFNNKITSMFIFKSSMMDNICFSSNLTKLEIIPDSQNAFSLIACNKNSLKDLSLFKVGSNFKWIFLNPTNGNSLIFKQLSNLLLNLATDVDGIDDSYSNVVNNNISQTVIMFPNLKTIELENINCNCLARLLTDKYVDISGVRTLEIIQSDNCNHDWCKSLDIKTDELGHLIKQSMPDITNINITKPSKNCLPLTDAINQQYTGQAKKIKLCTNRLCDYKFSSRNVVLGIYGSISDLNYTLNPKLYIDNLERIDFEMESNSFSWTWFTKQTCNDMLVFNKLEWLNIKFQEKTEDKQESCDNTFQPDYIGNRSFDSCTQLVDIILPSIQMINISFNNNMLGPLACKFSFELADKVKLTGPVTTLPICGNKDSMVLETQNIMVTSVGKADENYFYQFTNSWFGNTQPVCECSLSIKNMDIDLDLQKIDWRYVDDLQCHFDLEASKFINLLTLLPNAKSVAINCLTVADDVRDQVYIDLLNTIKPLSTVLTTVKFEFSDTVIDDSLKDLVIGYLLIALPSLTNVKISGYSFDILLFKDTYGKQYPHLYSVNTNLE